MGETRSRGVWCCPTTSTIGCLVLLFLSLVTSSSAGPSVKEVNKGSLAKFLKGKYFTLTYVDSTSCVRCRNLFPFYVAAAQAFPEDPEIFFTRTYDKELIKEWEVSELPALVYHKEGKDKPGFFTVDMTVDDIIDEIARVLFGNFDSLNRTYSVLLTEENYDEMVITPKQSAMVLIYNEVTSDKYEMIEKVAHSYRKDDAILFATINVDKHEKLRNDRFMTKDIPALMWLSAKDKPTAKRFGGMQTRKLLCTFINEQTGLNRNVDGAMNPDSGRIPEIDELLEEHADIIFDLDPDTLNMLAFDINSKKDTVAPHMQQMLEYYVTVLDHLVMSSSLTMLDELYAGLETRLIEDDELSTKTAEAIKRQKNIIMYYKDIMRRYKNGQWSTTRESGAKPDKEKSQTAAFVPSGHVHTEL